MFSIFVFRVIGVPLTACEDEQVAIAPDVELEAAPAAPEDVIPMLLEVAGAIEGEESPKYFDIG